jgi:hypothetical protein
VTVKYGNVYLFARRSNSSRSCLVRRILYGLLHGKIVPSRHQHNRREGQSCRNYTLLYLYNGVLSEADRLVGLEASGTANPKFSVFADFLYELCICIR